MSNISITDINGTVYDHCPRCQGKWIQVNQGFVHCENHNMPIINKRCVYAFINNYTSFYYLAVSLSYYRQPYVIVYRKNDCRVTYRFDQQPKEIILPILPFDITAKKLQSYLTYV